MIKPKNLIILAAVLVILIGVSLMQKAKHEEHTGSAATAVVLAGQFTPEQLGKLSIGFKGETEQLVLKNGPEGWVIETMFNARINDQRLSTLLRNFSDVAGEFRSDSDQVLQDYGLRDDQAVTLRGFDAAGVEVMALNLGNTAEGFPGQFIRIPNLSRDFDPEWATNGLLEKAGEFVMAWIGRQGLKGLDNLQMLTEEGRTPFLVGSMEGSKGKESKNIFFYGHIDKQPHLLPWREGLSPTEPVIENGKLYGRGSSDDGYAPFASAVIMKLLQRMPDYPRAVFLFEADEETESKDLIYYMTQKKDILGTPDMLICLDSGAGNYDQLWVTTSLRGIIDCQLQIKVLSEGVHSGMASGLVPSCSRIARQLLNRLEDVNTGEILPEFLRVSIPQDRLQEGQLTSHLLETQLFDFPVANKGQKFATDDALEGYLNMTWKSQLEVTGLDGLPALA